jgi:hypothetical protein
MEKYTKWVEQNLESASANVTQTVTQNNEK